MSPLGSESNIFIDVDDTIVMWGKLETDVEVQCPYGNGTYRLSRNVGNIKILKDRKARGSTIFVWSAGGKKWAEAVVDALGLREYVDHCLTKPHAYIDDKKAEEIMGEHIYIPYDSGYGKV